MLGEHDLLVVRALGIDDRIPVEALPGRHLDVVGEHPDHGESADDEDEQASQDHLCAGADLGAEEPEHDEDADDGIRDPHRQSASGQTEDREQDEGEGEPADQPADVVRGEEIGDGAGGLLRPDALDELP